VKTVAGLVAGLAATACRSDEKKPEPPAEPPAVVEEVDPTAAARAAMVDETIAARGLTDARVLAALK
jgi:hypothetical protein